MKPKQIVLITTLVLILIIIIWIIITGISKSNQKAIDEIYIYHSAFGQKFPEYKIDFKNQALWEFTSDCCENYIPRDSSLENEGFQFVKELSEYKIEKFLAESDKYRLTAWQEHYENNSIMDGHQWGMIITFSDASTLKVFGSNEYPDNWKNMGLAFKNLTDLDILILN